MKESIRRLNKLSPKSVLTLTQRKRLIDSLGESLAAVAEKNLAKSKLFFEDNQHGRNRKISGYFTVEECEEVARMLDEPSVATRMKEHLDAAVLSGHPFPSAMDILTVEELTQLIEACDS